MISETEIPLAILHCSTEMYCNPLFKFSTLLKSKPNVPTGDVLVEDTQDAVKSDTRQVKRTAIIPETFDSQDTQSVRAKRVRFSDESERSNVVPRAGTSGTTEDAPRNAAKRNAEIIPETVGSLNSVASRASNASERSDDSRARGVSMRILENAVVAGAVDSSRCDTIIPETCNSSNNSSSASEKNSLSRANEQRDVSRVSDATKIARKTNKRDLGCEIVPETCTSPNAESSTSRRSQASCEESERRNVVVNVFSNRVDGRSQVIPETRRPSSVNVLNIFSSQLTGKNCINNQPLRIFDENDVSTNKSKATVRIVSVRERNDSEENNSPNTQQAENLFRANAANLQQRENILMNEDDNFILGNVDVPSLEENERIVEKSTGNTNNDTSRERPGDSANKQIITIEETDDDYMTEQRKENNVPGKRATREEPKRLLKERQLDPAGDSERNRDNNRAKENETGQKNKPKPRNTVSQQSR